MRVRTALLLLLTLGFTLGLGVHPCDAAAPEHPTAKAEAVPAMPSCHAHAAPVTVKAGEDGHGCCGSESPSPGHSDHPCPHVCHATALLAVTPPLFSAQAVAPLIVGHVESPSAAPARSIDHVPLA